jgi:hypothetical protein
MSANLKRQGSTEIQPTSTHSETGRVSVVNPSREEEVRLRAYEIYLERGQQPGLSWTIGFKPNANLNAGCCGSRRLTRTCLYL